MDPLLYVFLQSCLCTWLPAYPWTLLITVVVREEEKEASCNCNATTSPAHLRIQPGKLRGRDLQTNVLERPIYE
jgi:hypothetical protein